MKQRLMVLALVGLAGQAMAGGLFFSEYCEGSSNNKYVEIYNATGADVDLSTVTVKLYSNGGVTPGNTFTGTGTLAAGDVYVIRNSSANATIQAFSDAVSTITFFNGDDALTLEVNSVVVDVIGFVGIDPGSSWVMGGDASGALDNTCVRNSNICDGFVPVDLNDWNANGSLEWTAYPMDTFTYGGSHTAFCGGGNVPPAIGAISYLPNPVSPGDNLFFDVTITDSDGTVTMAELQYGYSAGNLIYTTPLDPIGGDHFANSTAVVAPAACQALYYKVVATDDDNDTASTGEFSAPVLCELTIAQIQGGVAASPYAGQVVTTEGQVTYLHTSSSMFIQDGNGAWNGIQVFGPHPGVLEGDLVRVTGTVLEFAGFTEIAGSLTITVLESPGSLVIMPELLTVAQVLQEDYESVLVRVENTTCAGSVDPNTYVYDDTDQILVYRPGFTGEEDACYNVTGVRYAYQGTSEILPRTLDEITVCGTVDAREDLRFALGQAWPNPFNPVAQISFSLDRTAQARLSVFNVLGQEVAVLAEGLLAAGEHQVSFDATAMPSGLYFYSLQHEGRQLTGKMTLVR